MGVFFLIALIVPLAIYYIFIVLPLKMGVINKIENKRKRAIYFWLLMLFPVGDHIVGYVVYKALCFSVGGVHIYKTVTDVEEQRAYWFYEGLNVFDNSYSDEEYNYLSKNSLVKRGICTNLLKDGTVGNRVCAKDGFKVVYLNYCSTQYDTLPKDDPSYHLSCKNANELIAQYQLKNVIKVPKSSYRLNVKDYDFSIPLLNIEVVKDHGENIATKDKLYSSANFVFRGGWYLKSIGRYVSDMPFWVACNKGVVDNAYKEQYKKVGVPETVIPNPYKQQTNQGITQ